MSLVEQAAGEVRVTLAELAVLKQLDPKLLSLEGKAKRRMRGVLREWRQEVIDNVFAIQSRLRSALPDEIAPRFSDALSEVLIEAAQHGRRSTLRALGENPRRQVTRSRSRRYEARPRSLKQNIEADLGEISRQLRNDIKEHSFRASQRTLDRMRGDVMNTLTQSYEEGLGTRETAARLREQFDEMEDYELERIARTEVNSASNRSAFQTNGDFGVEFNQWVATHDSRTRDSHLDLDGEIAEYGDRFSNGLRYPGDMSGAVSEFINCRCRLVPYIPEPGEQVSTGRQFGRGGFFGI